MGEALYNIIRPVKFSQLAGQAETKKALKEAVNKGVLELPLFFTAKPAVEKLQRQELLDAH